MALMHIKCCKGYGDTCMEYAPQNIREDADAKVSARRPKQYDAAAQHGTFKASQSASKFDLDSMT